MAHARAACWSWLGLALAGAGCADPAPVDGDTTGPPPVATTSSTGHDASVTPETTASSSEGRAPTNFDLGPLPDGPEVERGCRKVDFLFVIDDSGSMAEQQSRLLDSFPGFIDAIQASLEGTVGSYHVGVVTSDAYAGNAPSCNSLGDLVTRTAGADAAERQCTPFAAGHRFATEQDDLSVKFPCMAQVGTSGSPLEQPVTAAIAALDPAKAGFGGCNQHFLRDDAILVLVLLTDDPPHLPDLDDAHPSTDTSGWRDAIVAAKHGDPQATVVIGFVPWFDVSCVVFNVESPNLVGFVESFGEQGVLASVCSDDYAAVLAQTVETIDATCAGFTPPG